MEYWNDGCRGRKTTTMTLPLLVSVIPSFHYSMEEAKG